MMGLCVYVQDANFATQLELAVRFGKTLIIQEVDGVEPMLYPLLRGDLISQGVINIPTTYFQCRCFRGSLISSLVY